MSAPIFHRGDLIVIRQTSRVAYADHRSADTRDHYTLAVATSVARDKGAVREYRAIESIYDDQLARPTKVDKWFRGTVLAIGRGVADLEELKRDYCAREWPSGETWPTLPFHDADALREWLRDYLAPTRLGEEVGR